jgi:GTPase
MSSVPPQSAAPSSNAAADASRPTCVLVAVRLPGVEDYELDASLAELKRLVTTLGYQVVGKVVQARQTLAPGAVLGEGKLEELRELTGVAELEAGADENASRREQREADEAEPKIALVAVDHELQPSQLRNLEKIVGTDVLDRTGVIIEIFHRHAQSREAKLQVEIARLSYTAPRARESPRGKEKHSGRGTGDSALELDRRRIRDRIAELRGQLDALQRVQSVRRAQRQDLRRVALVGYTNAGKSSLMRALTGSEVYVQDKLFATLDTTVRALSPEAKPRILVSDTVGFIKKLPHDLVASFKSTLDEALEASLLLHVVDASDPNWRSELEVTREVLEEIGATQGPRQLVMNKVDKVEPEAQAALEAEFPDAWFICAKDPASVAMVHSRIVSFFESSYVQEELVVPYTKQRLVSLLHELGRVLEERYEQHGVVVRVQASAEALESVRAQLA